jgi:hypothetical protein
MSLLGCVSATAQASEMISGTMTFSPYKLNASTTILGTLNITTTNGEVPSPLISLDMRFPPGMSFSASNLGLAACHPAALLSLGRGGCSENAIVGSGSAQVAVPLGGAVVTETSELTIFNGPVENNQTTVVLYNDARSPVYFESLMQGELVSGEGHSTETLLRSDLPIIPTLPGAGDVAVTSLKVSVGPRGLIYSEYVGHRVVRFQPRGLLLPPTCPPGGLRFSAKATFQDGSVVSRGGAVPCPHHNPRGTKRHSQQP